MKMKYAGLFAAVVVMSTMFSVAGAGAETLTAPVTINGAGGTVATATESGNVGIGTTPLSKLHIKDTVGSFERGFVVEQRSTGAAAAAISFLKASGPDGNLIPPTINENIGALHARPFGPMAVDPDRLNTSWFVATSSIVFTVDGTPNFSESIAARTVPTAISFRTGSNTTDYQERLRITSSGKVGVGTTAPKAQLHVVEGNATTLPRGIISAQHNDGAHGAVLTFLKSRGTADDPKPLGYDPATGLWDYVGAVVAQPWNSAKGIYDRSSQIGFRLDNTPKTAGGNPTAITFVVGESLETLTEAMRITSATNLGVGTSSPTQKLEVNGGLRLNSNSSRPACNEDSRGTFWVTRGATSDHVSVCLLKGNGSFKWVTLVSGANDEHVDGMTNHKESD